MNSGLVDQWRRQILLGPAQAFMHEHSSAFEQFIDNPSQLSKKNREIIFLFLRSFSPKNHNFHTTQKVLRNDNFHTILYDIIDICFPSDTARELKQRFPISNYMFEKDKSLLKKYFSLKTTSSTQSTETLQQINNSVKQQNTSKNHPSKTKFTDLIKEQEQQARHQKKRDTTNTNWSTRKRSTKEKTSPHHAQTDAPTAIAPSVKLLLVDVTTMDHYFPLLQKLTNHIIIISSYHIYKTYVKRNWTRSLGELKQCLEDNGNWVFLHDEMLYYKQSRYVTQLSTSSQQNTDKEGSSSMQRKDRNDYQSWRGNFSIGDMKDSSLKCSHRDESFHFSWEPLIEFICTSILYNCECEFTLLSHSLDDDEPAISLDSLHIPSHKPSLSHVHIETFITENYIQFLEDYKSLHAAAEKHEHLANLLFDIHTPLEVMRRHASELFFAPIHISEYTHKLGWIKVSHKNVLTRIVIKGLENLNRALHGDIVGVRLVGGGSLSTAQSSTAPLEGRVVGILQRRWRDYVACIQEADLDEYGTKLSSTAGSNLLVVPFSRRIPKVRVQTNQGDLFANQRLMIRIADWSRNSKYPTGHIVRAIGPMNNMDAEVESLLVEHDLHQVVDRFTPEALSELPPEDYIIPPEEFSKRRDLRESHFVCSIDPIGCEDIDDALSVRSLPDGLVEIGVHIADVTHFMKHDSRLDLEARKRASSIYLVDRRIDMIPSVLSAHLCSLHEKQDRLAVSVLWKLDADGNILDEWSGRTIIRSKYALHYRQAHNVIHGISEERVVRDYGDRVWKETVIDPKDMSSLKQKLTLLQEYARKFRAKREANGALSLADSQAVNFRLDANKRPIHLSPPEDIEIHHTIEEWMVQANHYVAKTIYESFRNESLIRIHPSPSQAKLEILRQAALSRGEDVRVDSNIALARSLKQCAKDDPELQYVIKTLATKSMQEAIYISTGSTPREDFFHYGLGLDFYTHFTSPIRRYADVLVHRLLLRAVGNVSSQQQNSSPLLTNKELQGICEHINHVTRASKSLQLDSSKWFRAIYFKEHPHTIERAVVDNVYEDRIHVIIPRYRISTAIFFSTKDDKLIVPPQHEREGLREEDTFSTVLNESSVTLTIPGLNRSYTFSIFDHVDVEINVKESRAHLPSIELTLQSFNVKSNGRLRKGRSKNVKSDMNNATEEEEPSEERLDRKEESLVKRLLPFIDSKGSAEEEALKGLHSQDSIAETVPQVENCVTVDEDVTENGFVVYSEEVHLPEYQHDSRISRLQRKRRILQSRLAEQSADSAEHKKYRSRLQKVEEKLQDLEMREFGWNRFGGWNHDTMHGDSEGTEEAGQLFVGFS